MTTHVRANGRDVSHKLDEAKKAFFEAAQLAKETAGTVSDKVIHDAKVHSKELQSQVTTYVKKKPMVALGGAVLAGFVLSWLLRR